MIPMNSNHKVGTVTETGYLATSTPTANLAENGKVYRWSHLFSAIPATTGNIMYIHFKPVVACSGSMSAMADADKVKIELFITPTTTADGTAISTYNTNQSLGTANADAYVKVYHTPTVTADGTKYGPDNYIYAASGNPSTVNNSGHITDEVDTIIDPTKVYLWKFTNIGDTATDVFVKGIIKVGA